MWIIDWIGCAWQRWWPNFRDLPWRDWGKCRKFCQDGLFLDRGVWMQDISSMKGAFCRCIIIITLWVEIHCVPLLHDAVWEFNRRNSIKPGRTLFYPSWSRTEHRAQSGVLLANHPVEHVLAWIIYFKDKFTFQPIWSPSFYSLNQKPDTHDNCITRLST